MFRTVPLSIISSFSLYTQQTCMTYTVAVCTVKNSWWWTEELSKTCRVLFQKQIWEIMHLAGLIIRMGYHCRYWQKNGFGGLGVACWPLVPKFAGSNLAEAVGFLGRKKILSTPSFGGEVKPSVPCRRFAACKRSLNLRGSRNLGKITTGHLSRPQFHLSLLGSLASLRTEARGG